MKRNLILIGFMGAGKTTIGKGYARKHYRRFVDTDELIVRKAGMSIPEIFETKGEAAFRQLETEVLEELLAENGPAVISVGGGLPLKTENRRLLHELGTVVYLDITGAEVWNRLAGTGGRPLLAGDNAREKMEELLSHRRPIYEQAADRIISVTDKTPEEVIDEL